MSDSLNTLLELSGYTFRLDKGYWVKFEAYLVNATEQIPHGISYSVTLHDRHNRRIVDSTTLTAIHPSCAEKSLAAEG